jgi:hypothetical protein
MWVVEGPLGPKDGGKRLLRFFWLKSAFLIANIGPITRAWLRPGRSYVVGRKISEPESETADWYWEQKAVSKRHVEIRVGELKVSEILRVFKLHTHTWLNSFSISLFIFK